MKISISNNVETVEIMKQYQITRPEFIHLKPTEDLAHALSELHSISLDLTNKDLCYYLDKLIDGKIDYTIATLDLKNGLKFTSEALRKLSS